MEFQNLKMTIVIGDKDNEKEIELQLIVRTSKAEELKEAFNNDGYYYYIKDIKTL